MSDHDLFSAELIGVKPLEQDKANVGVKVTSKQDFSAKKLAASAPIQSDLNYLSEFNRKLLTPYDIVSFKKPGIQEGVYRQLRLGKYACDARLDLHRMTVSEARLSVFDFIHESMHYELRTILIIHGKGDRDKGEKAILKNYCVQWLEEIPEVLAFHSAQKQDGGAGALYVLLKKSAKAKQKNRERFGLR